jgi:CO/xanthine dehydrogenase Mo-binding subunit
MPSEYRFRINRCSATIGCATWATRWRWWGRKAAKRRAGEPSWCGWSTKFSNLSAVKLHPGGNILHQGHFIKGNVEEGFARSAVIVEDTYQVPMMDHAYLETEAGMAYWEDDILVVDACGQYIYRDQTQVARALGLPLEKIRVRAPYSGGAFGGKDEITVQIHLALMAYHTRRPCKMVATRPESIISHTKRHPAKMHFKTGASRSGKLLAHQVRIVSDTGAYASLGGPVLNLMIEHAGGPYLIPNVKIDAYAVYTNNGISGAFRGFGCTQVCVAMESQMDRLAGALGLDPIEIRLKNALHQGDLAPLGYPMKLKVGLEQTLKSARQGKLWRERRRIKKQLEHHSPSLRPYIKRGVGVAAQMQGLGLGVGIPDYAEVALRLLPGPRMELMASTNEIGQGAYTSYALMLARKSGLMPEQIELKVGDTKLAPDSGTTTASRTTYAVGNALLQAFERLEEKLSQRAAEKYALSEPPRLQLKGGQMVGERLKIELGELLDEKGVEARATFHIPVQDVELGDGLPHLLYSYGTHVVLVEVNTLTGEITVPAVEAHLDGGKVIFRQGFEGQSEGGIAQGLGYALFEEVKLQGGRFLTTNFDTYVIPSAMDVPYDMRTRPVEVKEGSGPFGAKGISETCTVGVAPAVLNALADALGVHFTRLPVRAEDVLKSLGEKAG